MQFGGYYSSRPLFYIGRVPMDLTLTLIAAHIITALLYMILIGSGRGEYIERFIFSLEGISSRGWIWVFVTYVFVHEVSLWFAVEMLVFYWFGRPIEQFLGTRGFAWFYGTLVLFPALVMFFLSAWFPGFTLAGLNPIHFVVLVGFAMIQPNALLLFGIKVKWFAIVIMLVYLIEYLAARQWDELTFFIVSLGAAFFLLHRRAAQGPRVITAWLSDKTGLGATRMRARSQEKRAIRTRETAERKEQEVDAILDKISEEGLNSLTEREREILRKVGKRGRP